jgi:hypothetical protein
VDRVAPPSAQFSLTDSLERSFVIGAECLAKYRLRTRTTNLILYEVCPNHFRSKLLFSSFSITSHSLTAIEIAILTRSKLPKQAISIAGDLIDRSYK